MASNFSDWNDSDSPNKFGIVDAYFLEIITAGPSRMRSRLKRRINQTLNHNSIISIPMLSYISSILDIYRKIDPLSQSSFSWRLKPFFHDTCPKFSSSAMVCFPGIRAFRGHMIVDCLLAKTTIMWLMVLVTLRYSTSFPCYFWVSSL